MTEVESERAFTPLTIILTDGNEKRDLGCRAEQHHSHTAQQCCNLYETRKLAVVAELNVSRIL